MPSIADWKEPWRRVLYVFYVLDTSECMTGEPIAILNGAVTETLEALRQQAKSNADALVKIAVLEFSSGCRWMQPKGPEPLESFIWQDLKAGGLADMGAALKELDSKLSRHEFIGCMIDGYRPLIFFMTGSCATDDYKKALDQIRQNKWFARGTKIGLPIGARADVAMLADITAGDYGFLVQTEEEKEGMKRLLISAFDDVYMPIGRAYIPEFKSITFDDILVKAAVPDTQAVPSQDDVYDGCNGFEDIFNDDDGWGDFD